MKTTRLKKIFDYKRKNKITFVLLIILLLTAILLQDTQYLLFCTIISLFLMITKCYNDYRVIKIAKDIGIEELKLIETEIKNPIWVWQNYYILTDSYIIKQGFVVAIIKISDIILIYKKISPGNKSFNKKIVIVTNDGKKHAFVIDSTKIAIYGHYQQFEDVLKRKNAKILFGYTKQNVRLIKGQYGLKIHK